MDKLPILKIDPEFKDLIRPLRRKEYLQLEENILDEGCRDPIIIWNDYIIDGHNRYSICTKYSIPFNTVSKDFSSREEVIVWICKNQLGRRNITEETRKYLIGRQYESEKIIDSKKNKSGKNQHSLQSKQDDSDEDYIVDSEPKQSIQRSKNKTAHIIGAENNITHATVQKYAYFSRALDHIAEQCPELKTKILSGRYKISHKNILALEHLSLKELTQLNVRLDRGNHPFVQYCTTRSIIENEPKEEPKPHQPFLLFARSHAVQYASIKTLFRFFVAHFVVFDGCALAFCRTFALFVLFERPALFFHLLKGRPAVIFVILAHCNQRQKKVIDSAIFLARHRRFRRARRYPPLRPEQIALFKVFHNLVHELLSLRR